MKSHDVLNVTILAMAMGVAHAQTGEAPSLLKAQGCVACHHESKPRVGPSFVSIAAKRCENPGAALERFSSRLLDGSGHPKAALDDNQLKLLVGWICGLKRG